MNVKTLMKALSEYDPDMEVYFAHDSHDHWGSVLASAVGEIEETEVRYSDCHCSFERMDDEVYADYCKRDVDHKYVVLLS